MEEKEVPAVIQNCSARILLYSQHLLRVSTCDSRKPKSMNDIDFILMIVLWNGFRREISVLNWNTAATNKILPLAKW